MTSAADQAQDALMPLLNPKTLQLVEEHVEGLEAMEGSAEDRLLAVGLRMLLLNHKKRAAILRGKT